MKMKNFYLFLSLHNDEAPVSRSEFKRLNLLKLILISPKALLVFVLLTAAFYAHTQTNGDYQTRATGNWNENTTWQVYSGGAWTNCGAGDYPGVASGAGTVTILTAHIVTLNATPANSIGGLVTAGTGRLNQSNSSFTLTTGSFQLNGTAGNLVQAANSVITVTGNFSGNGDWDQNNPCYIDLYGNWSFSGTFSNDNRGLLRCKGSNSQTINHTSVDNLRSLIIDKSSVSNTVTLLANCNVRDGNLEVNTGTLDFDTYTINQTNNKAQLIVLSTGKMILGGNTGGQTGSNFPTGFTGANPNLSGTVEYDYPGNQTVYASPSAYNNLIITGSGTKSLGGNTSANGTLTINSGATLSTTNGANNYTLGSPTSVVLYCGASTGSTISGSGALTLGGNVTVTDDTGGTAGATISCPVALGATRTFNIADDGTSATDLTVSGVISGATFGITKEGAGTMALSNANSYTGLTTVSAGTLAYGASNVISTGAVTVDGATAILSISSWSDSVGTVTVDNGGSITGSTGVLTSTGTFEMKSGSATAILGGGVALNKTTTGTVTLSGTNTYTGLTTVSAGVLNIQNAQGTGTTAGGVTVASGAALELQGNISVGAEALTLNNGGIGSGGSFRNISGNNTWGGTITLSTNPVRINSDAGTLTLNAANAITATNIGLTVGGSGNTSISGTITTGSGSLAKDGSGTLTLSGSNTFTGGVTINNGGILKLGNTGALNSATPNSVTFGASSTGKLQLFGNSVTISGLNTNATPGSPIVENGNSVDATLTLNLTGNNTFAGLFQDGSSGKLALIKSGTGTLTLSAANTYTGGTTLNTGQLNINHATAIGTGAFTIAGGTFDNTSGGAITLSNNNTQSWNGNFTFAGTNNLNLGTGAVTLSADRQVTVSANTLTVGGTINDNTKSLTKAGGGKLAFGSQSVTINTMTISAGEFASTSGNMSVAGDWSNSGTFTHNSGTVTFNGNGNTQSLSGNNTFYNLTINHTGANNVTASGSTLAVASLLLV